MTSLLATPSNIDTLSDNILSLNDSFVNFTLYLNLDTNTAPVLMELTGIANIDIDFQQGEKQDGYVTQHPSYEIKDVSVLTLTQGETFTNDDEQIPVSLKFNDLSPARKMIAEQIIEAYIYDKARNTDELEIPVPTKYNRYSGLFA